MLRFIYLLSKAIYPGTTFLACISFYVAASTSDYYVMELGQTEPEIFKYFMIGGLILLIPCVIYSLLNLLVEIAKARVAKKAKVRRKHNAIHR